MQEKHGNEMVKLLDSVDWKTWLHGVGMVRLFFNLEAVSYILATCQECI